MKIGLLGGSFNPVHLTHIDVARAVRKRLGLDEILLVPAGNPYHKGQSDMLPEGLRYELVAEAVKGEDGLSVSDIDMNKDMPTYTVDTLREARVRYPDAELYFIMGQDSFDAFMTWKNWQNIPKLANIIAVSRAAVCQDEMLGKLKKIFHSMADTSGCVWEVKGGKKVYILNDLNYVISSTQVRNVWKKGGNISELVPSGVAVTIAENYDEIATFWT